MATNYRLMACSPADVFDVIADGWVYPTWVVGASRIREVDEAWPLIGSQLHHSFGVWPALIDDRTTMLEWDPPRHARMRARGWPIGEAIVTIDVKPRRTGCVVCITEVADKGPGAIVPQPVLDVPIWYRNVETLKRLAFVAEGRAH